MKRRAFIRRGIQTALTIYSLPLCNVYANIIDKNISKNVLSRFVDTIIPEDSTPAASQLSLDIMLIKYSKTIKNYTKLIELGCEWLNLQAHSKYKMPFDVLNEAQREAIVTLAEESALGSIPKLFFDRVCSDLLRLYYSVPQSWIGLGFNQPPQPHGYPDYINKFNLSHYD